MEGKVACPGMFASFLFLFLPFFWLCFVFKKDSNVAKVGLVLAVLLAAFAQCLQESPRLDHVSQFHPFLSFAHTFICRWRLELSLSLLTVDDVTNKQINVCWAGSPVLSDVYLALDHTPFFWYWRLNEGPYCYTFIFRLLFFFFRWNCMCLKYTVVYRRWSGYYSQTDERAGFLE